MDATIEVTADGSVIDVTGGPPNERVFLDARYYWGDTPDASYFFGGGYDQLDADGACHFTDALSLSLCDTITRGTFQRAHLDASTVPVTAEADFVAPTKAA